MKDNRKRHGADDVDVYNSMASGVDKEFSVSGNDVKIN